jgi:hypothetical protein
VLLQRVSEWGHQGKQGLTWKGQSRNCHAFPCTKTATTRPQALSFLSGVTSVMWYVT